MDELEMYKKVNKELRVALYSIRKELEEAKECINMHNMVHATVWSIDKAEMFIDHSLKIIDEMGE